MKNTVILMMFALISTSKAVAQDQIAIGNISLVGSACASTLAAPKIEEGKLLLPVGLNVKKTSSESLKRGTCNMALAVAVPARNRLIISNTSVVGMVNLKKGGASKVQVELFKAGEHGEILQAVHDATAKKLTEVVDLKSQGDMIATQCGEAITLRANMSAIIKGAARSTVRMDSIETDVRLEACE